VATYKLIQDIEAEDHILGPLTLRQFIFALIAAFLFYLCFLVVNKGVPFLLIVFGPPALFFGFFALPFGRDQPTEIWALAKLRYFFKPRVRVWNQSGVKELVTITVPKKIERILTNGLSQDEVKSRLQALANTIDSRGWAIKNVNTFGVPAMAGDSERLIDIGSLPQEVPAEVMTASDDIMDNRNSPVARQFDTMISQSSRTHHQQLIDQMNDIRSSQPGTSNSATNDSYWFIGQGTGRTAPAATNPITAAPTMPSIPISSDDATLSQQLKALNGSQVSPYDHLRTLQPIGAPGAMPNGGSDQDASATTPINVPPVTAPSDPAILSLANNNDLNVATLAREAQKAKGDDPEAQDEVVISLH
jgi:hypothetical protein